MQDGKGKGGLGAAQPWLGEGELLEKDCLLFFSDGHPVKSVQESVLEGVFISYLSK